MDLKKFIEVNIANGFITPILGGIENSSFYPEDIDLSLFIKKILDLSEADKQQIFSQLQSGGISEAQLNAGIVKKKLSFCTDFPTIVNNILALLGYDFAKHLIALYTLPLRLKKLISEIPTCKSYEECGTRIRCVQNILSLQSSDSTKIFTIDDSFDINNYAILDSEFMEAAKMSFNTYIGKTGFLEGILQKINKLIFHKSIVLINKDKQNWSKVLNDLLNNITIGAYNVNTLDELCLYLDDYDVGYRGSFIRQFELLYRENYSDVSLSVLTEDYIKLHKPHIKYLNSINFDNYNSYLMSFVKYFRNIQKLCHASVFTYECMNVILSDDFFEQLSHITLNLFIRVAKNIASAQAIQSYFGKSNRVQFIQIMSAIIACQPRAEEFSVSQREALHYFLLTSKLLNESYAMLSKREGI